MLDWKSHGITHVSELLGFYWWLYPSIVVNKNQMFHGQNISKHYYRQNISYKNMKYIRVYLYTITLTAVPLTTKHNFYHRASLFHCSWLLIFSTFIFLTRDGLFINAKGVIESLRYGRSIVIGFPWGYPYFVTYYNWKVVLRTNLCADRRLFVWTQSAIAECSCSCTGWLWIGTPSR